MGIDISGLESRLFDAYSKTTKNTYMYINNMATGVSRWSKNCAEIFDIPGEYFLNAGEICGNLIHPDDRQKYFDDLDELFSGKKDRHELDYRVMTKDGEYVLCSCRGIIQRGKLNSDEPDLFVGIIENHNCINGFDGITNLYNIYELQKNLSKKKYDNLTILLIGICSFSEINDLYGYAYGNKILQSLSSKILDICGDKAECYKADGVKFVLCFNNIDSNEISSIYNRICQMARYNLMVNNERVSLSLAGGVLKQAHLYEPTTALSGVRYALFQSKREKNGELVFYNSSLFENNKENLELIQAIKNDISQGFNGFFLCYQPVVDLDGELVGVEALIRWRNANNEIINPNRFIPVLEQDASFFDLSKWVMVKAMNDMEKVVRNFEKFTVNINLSYSQISNPNFRSAVKAAISETKFPASKLCFELTERCRLLDLDFLRGETEFIENLGAMVAIDDFGTGFSSLTLLSKLNVSVLKIDREFVKNIENDRVKKAIVKSITNCANDLDISVCVEGIETEMQAKYIKNEFKVNTFQGFLYSVPLDIKEFRAKYLIEEKIKKYDKTMLKKFKYFNDYPIDLILDNLTGTIKKEYVLGFTEYLIKRGIPFSFQIIDIDNFKLINDNYGHYIGDLALTEIGGRLVKYVGDIGIVGRFGGDEFIIINLEDIKYDDVYEFLRKLYGWESIFRRTMTLKGVSPFITATVGSASYPINASNSKELFQMADKALYRGKIKGRNCFIVYVHEKHKDIDLNKKNKKMPSTQITDLTRIFDVGGSKHEIIKKALKYIEDVNGIYRAVVIEKDGEIISNGEYDEKKCMVPFESIYNDVNPNMTTFVCDNFFIMKDKTSAIYEHAQKYGLCSLVVSSINYKEDHFGYLLFAEKNNLRIWQEENLIILNYLAKLISILIKFN